MKDCVGNPPPRERAPRLRPQCKKRQMETAWTTPGEVADVFEDGCLQMFSSTRYPSGDLPESHPPNSLAWPHKNDTPRSSRRGRNRGSAISSRGLGNLPLGHFPIQKLRLTRRDHLLAFIQQVLLPLRHLKVIPVSCNIVPERFHDLHFFLQWQPANFFRLNHTESLSNGSRDANRFLEGSARRVTVYFTPHALLSSM